jgi:hypothetical protein
MGFAGRLEGIAPSDIFQIISQSRMTGTLIARCPDGTAMIVFKDGQVMEAASDAAQESLGHLLVSQGLMSEKTIEAAQDRLKQEPDRSLGAILVQMGAISEKALDTVVYRQIGYIVQRLMSCDDGFITFDRGDMAVKRKLNTREFFLPSGVSPEYLIMEGARVVDEERRKKPDRRTHAPGPAIGAEPTQEHAPAQASAVLPMLSSWFQSITSDLRRAAKTVFRKGQRIARSAIDLARRELIPWLKKAPGKVRAFSPDGRALIVAGIIGVAVGAALIVLTAHSSRTAGSELLVTGRVVKVRANPTTDAKVVAKMERGETVSSISFNEGWHQVRTRTGDTGWVWQSLVERKETKSAAVGYGTIGYGLVLVTGVALLITGIIRQRKGVRNIITQRV